MLNVRQKQTKQLLQKYTNALKQKKPTLGNILAYVYKYKYCMVFIATNIFALYECYKK